MTINTLTDLLEELKESNTRSTLENDQLRGTNNVSTQKLQVLEQSLQSKDLEIEALSQKLADFRRLQDLIREYVIALAFIITKL